MKMILILFILFLVNTPTEGEYTPTGDFTAPMVEHLIEVDTRPIEKKKPSREDSVKVVQHLLDYVPKDQVEEFIDILDEFASERGFDWRVVLLVMYQESKLDVKRTGIYLKSYVGLVMFGTIARKQLNVTRSQVLAMNHVQQAKLAVRMWKITEKQTGVKIHSFLSLHVCNFYPLWMKYLGKGGELPSTEDMRKQNYPLLDKQGKFTEARLLEFYKNKIEIEKELHVFRDFELK